MATILYWYDEGTGQTHEVRFSAIPSETYEDTTTLTDHPVETGSSMTDHARDEPPRVLLEGVVSSVLTVGEAGTLQTPLVQTYDVLRQVGAVPTPQKVPEPPMDLSLTGVVGAGLGALFPKQPIVVDVPVFRRVPALLQLTQVQRLVPGDKPREIYDLLLEAKAKKALFVLSGRFRDHFDLAIERVALLRTPEDGTSGRFQLDLRRIVITSTETVAVPAPLEARGAGPRSKGAQATKPAETPSAADMKSTLFSGGQSIGLF